MKFEKGNKPPNLKDMTGMKFGLLVVISKGDSRRNKAAWECLCVCGKTKTITGDALRQGQASCGCAHGQHSKTHGKTKTKAYSIWRNMLNRCFNNKVPAYKDYGGRGITVCERWRDFNNFFFDMGECPEGFSIERKDNDLNYEPSNCEWIPLKDQAKNKRTTVSAEGLSVKELSEKYNLKESSVRYRLDNNVSLSKKVGRDKIIAFNGISMNQKQWAKFLGLSYTTIGERIRKGYPTEKVLSPGRCNH